MPDPPTDPSQPPRAHRRQRVLKSARIIFNNGLSSYDAVLRKISEKGARLKLEAAIPVPLVFELLILNPNIGKPQRHVCERRWQRADFIGAKFIEAEVLADAARQDRRPLLPLAQSRAAAPDRSNRCAAKADRQ